MKAVVDDAFADTGFLDVCKPHPDMYRGDLSGVRGETLTTTEVCKWLQSARL